MSYTVEIAVKEFSQWPEYKEYNAQMFERVIMEKYPEILSVKYSSPITTNFNRYFTFKSEEHYHWFLLKL
jgi:hypothetical protein